MNMDKRGGSTWNRIVEVFRQHVESGGRGSLRVDTGEDGARRISLALDLKDGLVRWRRKPPGRRRRDQLRREAWLRRKEEKRWSPPGDGVGYASGRDNRLDSRACCMPGVEEGEGGEEEKRGQATSRLETEQHGNSGATSHHDGMEEERIIEGTAPAPEERQGEKLDKEILRTDIDIYTAALDTIKQVPDDLDTDMVTTPSGTTLSRLQTVTPMVIGEKSFISLEEHIKLANQCTQKLMKKYQKK